MVFFSNQMLPDLSTAMLTMSGLYSCADCVADGRLTLMFAVRLICKLIIMKDASRKNMMSISGMMTIRERRLGMGEIIFIGNSMAGGMARRCRFVQMNRIACISAADHHFDIRCGCFQVEL